MKKPAAALLTAMAMAAAPVVIAPAAHAEICADAGGRRHLAVGGCTDIADRAATGAAIAAATDPYRPGEEPCYTVEGVRITRLMATPANGADAIASRSFSPRSGVDGWPRR